MKLTVQIILCLAAITSSGWGQTAPSGQTGSKGIPGPQGPTGIQGDKGDQGPKGYRGSPGANGVSGLPGVPGYTGGVGATGLAGLQGQTGNTGATGGTGSTGLTGFKGDPGPIGALGQDGQAGPKGQRGPQGERNTRGDQGEKGVAGPQGDQGVQGAFGATGDKGSRGSPGQVGLTLAEQDVNECVTGVSSCMENSQCVNTALGYTCICIQGFKEQQINNKSLCIDVDECAVENGGCSEQCINEIGSFRCSCTPALLLAADGICYDIDECTASPCNLDKGEICVNNRGLYDCISMAEQAGAVTPSPLLAAFTLKDTLVKKSIVVGIIIWLALLTLFLLVMLSRLIYILNKSRNKQKQSRLHENIRANFEQQAADIPDEDMTDEQMRGQDEIDIDIAIPDRSRPNTLRGRKDQKAASSYTAKSKEGTGTTRSGRQSTSSITSADSAVSRTASVKPQRVATGERNQTNRGMVTVDTLY